jgi:hypothetical protein
MTGSMIYVGPATGAPSIGEQTRQAARYARDQHGHRCDENDIETAVENIETGSTTGHIPPGAPLAYTADHFKNDRSAADAAIEFACETDGVDRLILADLAVLTRTTGVLTQVIDRLNAHGVTVETVRRGYRFPQPNATPGKGYLADDDGNDVPDEQPHPCPHEGHAWNGGRPPLGYDVIDGRLARGDDYAATRRALLAYDAREIGRAEAARRADCSRHSIDRCVDDPARRARYALD